MARRLLIATLCAVTAGCTAILGLRDDYDRDATHRADVGADAPISGGDAVAPLDVAIEASSYDAPLPPSCSNGAKDADESDIDCGGATCAPCKNGRACAADDDCGGGRCHAGACSGWTMAIPARVLSGYRPSLVVGADGAIYLAFSFTGTIDLGLGSVTADKTDALVVKYSRAGKALWQRVFRGDSDEIINSIAFDEKGALLVSAQTSGDTTTFTTFGGKVQSGNGCTYSDVARIGSDGSFERETLFYGGGAIVPGPAGEGEIGVGTAVCFPLDTVTPVEGAYDVFAVGTDGIGGVRWSRSWPRATYEYLYSAAMLPGGDVVGAFAFYDRNDAGPFDVGDASLVNQGYWDWGVARFGAEGGAPVWARAIGSAYFNEYPWAAAVDGKGDVLLAGSLGLRDFRGGALGADHAGFGFGKLDPDGNVVWSRVSVMTPGDDPAYNYASGVAGDAQGRMYLAGVSEPKSIDLGCGAKTSAAPGAGHFAVMDESGRCIVHRVSDGGRARPRVALRPGVENVVLAGTFWGAVDFGAGAATSTSADAAAGEPPNDVFLTSLGDVVP